jgi:hypothetical protein
MQILPLRKSILLLVVAALFFVLFPAGRAQSSLQLDKHARRIEKHLAKYRPGTLLQVDLRNDSEALGALGVLSDETFELTSSDNNRRMTISYADVARVKKGKEYIGEGSEGHHVRLWVPLVIGAAAVGGGIAAYEASR